MNKANGVVYNLPKVSGKLQAPAGVGGRIGANTINAGGGTFFETDETLTLKDGVLSVNTADAVEADNTLPITSAAVHTTVGNIEILLGTI